MKYQINKYKSSYGKAISESSDGSEVCVDEQKLEQLVSDLKGFGGLVEQTVDLFNRTVSDIEKELKS